MSNIDELSCPRCMIDELEYIGEGLCRCGACGWEGVIPDLELDSDEGDFDESEVICPDCGEYGYLESIGEGEYVCRKCGWTGSYTALRRLTEDEDDDPEGYEYIEDDESEESDFADDY